MNKIRLAGWLAVGGLLGAALLAPSAALATDLHASQQGTAWNDPQFQGSAEDCDGLKLGPGDVVWHFVLTSPDADSGHLTATFDKAGDKTVENADSPAAVLHFYVWTGHDTLLDAETTDVDGNNLNLSHICAGKEVESESVPVETASRPGRDRAAVPVETESVPVETATVPVETEPPRSRPRPSRPRPRASRRRDPVRLTAPRPPTASPRAPSRPPRARPRRTSPRRPPTP